MQKYKVNRSDLELESPLVGQSIEVTYLDIDYTEEGSPKTVGEPLSMFSTKGTVVEDASGMLCLVNTILVSKDAKKHPLYRGICRIPKSLIKDVKVLREG